MGDDMINYLAKPIQCEDDNARIDLHPKLYYQNNNNVQFTSPVGNSIPVDCNGVLPCIAVCIPNQYEVENCERIALTSIFDWGPYGKREIFYKVEACLNNIESVLESFKDTDPISAELL